jgi:hypothetical protein
VAGGMGPQPLRAVVDIEVLALTTHREDEPQ